MPENLLASRSSGLIRIWTTSLALALLASCKAQRLAPSPESLRRLTTEEIQAGLQREWATLYDYAGLGDRMGPVRAYREEFARRRTDLPEEFRQAIHGGHVVPGMTPEQVCWSWGVPTEEVGAEWRYKRGNNRTQVVAFEDGFVSSVRG